MSTWELVIREEKVRERDGPGRSLSQFEDEYLEARRWGRGCPQAPAKGVSLLQTLMIWLWILAVDSHRP